MAYIFDEAYYLTVKTAQQNAIRHEGRSDWTIPQVAVAIAAIGWTSAQHYEICGRDEGLNPNSFFDEAYYLKAKTAQQNAIKHGGRVDWTVDEVAKAIASIGMIPVEHYEAFGRSEGVKPNASFDEAYYLKAKADQQNSIKHGGRSDWTVDEVAKAIASIGMIPAQHYVTFGCFETNKNGAFINPALGVSTERLWESKLAELQAAQPEGGWTLETMLAAYQTSGNSVFSGGYSPDPEGVGKAIVVDGEVVESVYGTPYNDILILAETGVIAGGYYTTIYGDGGDDVIIIHGTARSFGGSGGNDVIIIHGTVRGDVRGFGGNDTIIVNAGATVNSLFWGDTGADRIILRTAGVEMIQWEGDSGDFSHDLVDASGVVPTTSFDLVDTGGLNALLLLRPVMSSWAAGVHEVSTVAEIGAADDTVYWVRGASGDGTFTADASGSDILLVYDIRGGREVHMEAIVALGVADVAVASDGFIALNPAG